MKNLVKLSYIFILLLIGCSTETESLKSTVLNDLIQFSYKCQSFTVCPDSPTILYGEKGTIIKIKPNSFLKKDGSIPRSEITLEIKEIYRKSQMIYNGLATMSNNKLLESGGMIYINASSGQDSLILNKQIVLHIPNKFDIHNGQYFKGELKAHKINWVLNDFENERVITIERRVTLSYGPDSVISEKLKIVGNDTIPLSASGYLDYKNDLSYKGDTAGMEQPIEIPKEFLLNVNELGWVNCDYFYDIPNPVSLTLHYNGDQNLSGYLIYHGLSSVSYLNFHKGVAHISPLPSNEPITILAFSKFNNEYSFYKNEIVLGTITSLNVNLKKCSLDQIVKEISKLD